MSLLYYTKNTGWCLFVPPDEMIKCYNCDTLIEYKQYFFIHKSWTKRRFNKEIYCKSCVKAHMQGTVDEYYATILTNVMLPNSKVDTDAPPILKASTTVFDAALSNKNITSDTTNTKTVDHTRLAFKTDQKAIDEVHISKQLTEARINELDTTITKEKELGAVLGILKDAEVVPALPESKIKKIEQK